MDCLVAMVIILPSLLLNVAAMASNTDIGRNTNTTESDSRNKDILNTTEIPKSAIKALEMSASSDFSFDAATDVNFSQEVITFMGIAPVESTVTDGKYLPRQWSKSCSVKPGIECLDPSTKPNVVSVMRTLQPVCVSCEVGPDDIWNFHDLRQFLQDSSARRNYAVTVRCKTGSNITLPWPMRADSLAYIFVQNCLILEGMSEYFTQELNLIPDTIVYYAMIDSVIYVDTLPFLSIARRMQFMTKSSKCGPERELLIAINRNISYAFSSIPVSALEKGRDSIVPALEFYRGQSVSQNSCSYTKLIEIDRSVSKNLGSKHDSVMLQNSEFPEVRLFNLSYDKLRKIPVKLEDWRLYFPRMKYLDLSHNNITEFKNVMDYGRSKEDPTVGIIDLRYNNITTITLKELRRMQIHKFVKVDIRNNPFICNCEMRDFVEFFQHQNNLTTKGANSQYDYLRYLECQKPDDLKGRKIVSLKLHDLGCEIETTTLLTAPIIALCIIIVILVVFIVVIIKYRKEIVILAFTRLNIVLPCQRVEDHAGKKYDAFVSYSRHDSDWVLRTLVRGLEHPNDHDTFKLCLHQRDFAVGAPIAENIVKSVEASRHTILVISRKFLESEWCLMEFRTAFHQSLLERKKHLIIITLEHIPPNELDADLKRCMQTLTYTNINDRLFWDKIIFSLSDKRKGLKNKNYVHNIKRVAERNKGDLKIPPNNENENNNIK